MKQMKKAGSIYFFLIAVMIGMMICLSVMGSVKKAVSCEYLKTVSDELGYKFHNVTEGTTETAEIVVSDSAVIYYIKVSSEREAVLFFEKEKKKMESFGDISKTTSINLGNHYSKWYTNGKMKNQFIMRVDDMILHTVYDVDNQDKINEFFNEIGY